LDDKRQKRAVVTGADIQKPAFGPSRADEFVLADLREPSNCRRAVEGVEEVYDLAADMGGMDFISKAEVEVLRNNALININMAHTAAETGVDRYFFSSSVCVYRDMRHGEPLLTEDDAIPANPDNEYGWEKLYADRVAMAAAAVTERKSGSHASRTATGPRGLGTEGEKRPQQLSVAKLRKPRMAAQSKSGATGRRSATTPMSMTW
jgi:nucleoside-diphosphate-sugar epimerase